MGQCRDNSTLLLRRLGDANHCHYRRRYRVGGAEEMSTGHYYSYVA